MDYCLAYGSDFFSELDDTELYAVDGGGFWEAVIVVGSAIAVGVAVVAMCGGTAAVVGGLASSSATIVGGLSAIATGVHHIAKRI